MTGLTTIGEIIINAKAFSESQTWYFSFGHGHYDAERRHLLNYYTTIDAATEADARQLMVSRRGQNWCTSYSSPEALGVERFGLVYIVFKDLTAGTSKWEEPEQRGS